MDFLTGNDICNVGFYGLGVPGVLDIAGDRVCRVLQYPTRTTRKYALAYYGWAAINRRLDAVTNDEECAAAIAAVSNVVDNDGTGIPDADGSPLVMLTEERCVRLIAPGEAPDDVLVRFSSIADQQRAWNRALDGLTLTDITDAGIA
jgi:hypothetical protein